MNKSVISFFINITALFTVMLAVSASIGAKSVLAAVTYECKAYRYKTNGCSGSGQVTKTWESATDVSQPCLTCKTNQYGSCISFYNSQHLWGCSSTATCTGGNSFESGRVVCTKANPTNPPNPTNPWEPPISHPPTDVPPPVELSATPVPSATSAVPTVTGVPPVATFTSVPDDSLLSDPYLVPIGNKPSLTVNIGGGVGDGPPIRFKAKLVNTENNPEMYFRLRVIDDQAFTQTGYTGPTCDNPGSGGKDYYIPAKADANGVYSPVSSISQVAPSGAAVPPISSDGWITLSGLSSGRYYSFILKGPKTRGGKLTEHIVLAMEKVNSQDFDWTAQPLEPGDLPDPNNNMKQDCIVNSVDISLIRSRIGACCNPDICSGRSMTSSCPDWDKLQVGDVNYDGVINANDVAKVVYTLSTKPDDDN